MVTPLSDATCSLSTTLRRPLLITAKSEERRQILGMPRVFSGQSGNRGICSRARIFRRISCGSESKQRCLSRLLHSGSEGMKSLEIPASSLCIGAMLRFSVHESRLPDLNVLRFSSAARMPGLTILVLAEKPVKIRLAKQYFAFLLS